VVLVAEPLNSESGVSDGRCERFTEAQLLDMLRERHVGRAGNGPRWAFATHVRDKAGFDASRTLDAVAMDTWPSSGLALHGYEVKCSRADWLRELAQPWKAAAFTRWLDFFWVVAAPKVVRDGELPARWGLLEVHGNGLRSVVGAVRLDPEPLDRSFVAALLRAVCHRSPASATTGLAAVSEKDTDV
jgi:hypothetical protein